MSLLTEASLIVTPNAYKEGTLLAIVPSSGAGDLSWTRNSGATRVNSAGLIENVPYNLLQYSEQFTDSPWFTINSPTVTANTVVSPSGLLNADTVSFNGSPFGQLQQAISATIGQVYTFSIWIKSNSSTSLDLFIGDNSSTVTITPNWTRISITKTITSATASPKLVSSSVTTFDIYGAQLVEGSVPKDYLPTTTRLNIPRLDYSNGSCPSILLEPQRTNLCVQSNAFNTTPWASTSNLGTNPVITTNYGISPDGTQNALRVQLARTNSNSSYSQIFQYPVTVTSGQPYSWSVWLKSLSGTPTISIVGDFGRPPVTLTSEWVRYYGTGTAPTSMAQLEIAILGSAFSSGNSLTADFLIWGYQFEQGSYPTSYIPTIASTVTRVSDYALIPQGNISNFGTNPFTIFMDINFANPSLDGSIALLGNRQSGYWWRFVYVSGILVLEINSTLGYDNISILTMSLSTRKKIAVARNGSNMKFYIDGILVLNHTDLICSGDFTQGNDWIELNTWSYGNSVSNVSYNSIITYKTALTDDQLEQLTGIGFNTYIDMANYYNYIVQ